MDDRMRISDADREQVTTRLRDHYAAGRLTSEELDERVTAALSAKTYGDLRRIMADLPEPVPAGADSGAMRPHWAAPRWAGPRSAGPPVFAYRRGPRLLPLALLVLFAAIILPPVGFVFFAFLKVILLIWLVTCVAGLFAAARFRRHIRRHSQPGNSSWRGW
jgi:Domain of unknown function (DUF1707)